MSIEENKIKKFQEICEDMARKTNINLEKEINTKISEEISNKLKNYSEKLDIKLKKQEDDLRKDFNKKISELELSCKKEILKEKQREQKIIYNETVNKLKEYANTNEYISLLNNIVEKNLNKNATKNTISLRKIDKAKLENKYNCEIKELADSYIGGVIIQNDNVIIDCTFLTALQERQA